MASLQSSTLLLSSSASSSSSSSSRKFQSFCYSNKIISALQVPSLKKPLPQLNLKQRIEQLNLSESFKDKKTTTLFEEQNTNTTTTTTTYAKIYAILEAISDRIEMHNNIGEQRQSWNSLLLNSVNMITLTGALMAGLAGGCAGGGSAILGLKLSSTLLFSSATGLLAVMNKIQPSQLVEEQRNAVRLFKQLETRIRTKLDLGLTVNEDDVEEAMESVLALDKAYPLPLLGAMLDKFPKTFEPATWWPNSKKNSKTQKKFHHLGEKINGLKVNTKRITDLEMTNGWSKDLEEELREIAEVIKKKDLEDYVTLGNKALKLHKMLAISGPLLTGVAATGSVFVGQGAAWAVVVAALAGSLAAVFNTVEHGGQVGMVFEMYRNSAGFFRLLEERVETAIEEEELGFRENGEVFEMKMALSLGRSLSQLRNLAAKSRRCCVAESCVDEFASKLF